MKGITPVIAIILLLLITISMVGFAFVWFSRVAQESTSDIGKQINNTIGKSAKTVSVPARTTTTVSVRNTGTATILTSELALFIDGGVRTCTWAGAITSLAPSAVGTCTFSGAACSSPSVIKVDAPGNSDEVTCP